MKHLSLLIGFLFLLNTYIVTPAFFHSAIKPEQDILSRLFDERVLELTETDFLIRLSETEMRGFSILSDRKEDILRALTTQIRGKTLEEVIDALVYAFNRKYLLAFEFMIKMIPSLDEIIEASKLRDGISSEFIEELEFHQSLDEYVQVSNEELEIDPSEFEHLPPQDRLPAVIKKLVGAPTDDDSNVDSKFLTDFFIGKFNLRTNFIIYEIEMMDKHHVHDRKGVIESYLKGKMFMETNGNMAQMALEMFSIGCFSSLKFIIDKKFSFESPFSKPLWFQDLSFLMDYASSNQFPKDFFSKVIDLANPSVMRRYADKVQFGIDKLEFSLKDSQSDDESTEITFE